MKKIVRILVIGVMCMFLFGCGGKSYQVDYQGQMGRFTGAKSSYKEGQKVELYYDLIATDTDYYFYVDGKSVNPKYDEKKGYIIQFTMPDHDIEVYCKTVNSMEKQITEYDEAD